MAIKKTTKVVKKVTKTAVKSSKMSVKPVKQAVKKVEKPATKKAVKLKAAPKIIVPQKEASEVAIVKKTVKHQKVQTAEGWKRMMLKKQAKK